MPIWFKLSLTFLGILGVLYLISLLYTAAIKAAERRKIRLDEWDTYD